MYKEKGLHSSLSVLSGICNAFVAAPSEIRRTISKAETTREYLRLSFINWPERLCLGYRPLKKSPFTNESKEEEEQETKEKPKQEDYVWLTYEEVHNRCIHIAKSL